MSSNPNPIRHDAPPQLYSTPLTNLVEGCFEEEQYQEGFDLLDQLRDSGFRPSNDLLLLLFSLSLSSPPLNPPPRKALRTTKSTTLPKTPSIQTVLFATDLLKKFSHQNSLGVDGVLNSLPNLDLKKSDRDDDDEDDETRNLPLNVQVSRIKSFKTFFDSLFLPDFYSYQSTILSRNGPSALSELKQKRKETSNKEELMEFFGLEKVVKSEFIKNQEDGNEEEDEEDDNEEEDDDYRSFDYDLTSLRQTKDLRKLIKFFDSDLNREVILQSGKRITLKTLIGLWKSQREGLMKTQLTEEEKGRKYNDLNLSKQFKTSQDSHPSLEITKILDLTFAFFNSHSLVYQKFELEQKIEALKEKQSKMKIKQENQGSGDVGGSSGVLERLQKTVSSVTEEEANELDLGNELEEMEKFKASFEEPEIEKRARYSIGADLLNEILHLATCTPPILDTDALVRGITSRLGQVNRLGLDVLYRTISPHQSCLHLFTRCLTQTIPSTRALPSNLQSSSLSFNLSIPNSPLKNQEFTIFSDLIKTVNKASEAFGLELNGKYSLLELDLEDRIKIRRCLKLIASQSKPKKPSVLSGKKDKIKKLDAEVVLELETGLRLDKYHGDGLWRFEGENRIENAGRRYWKPVFSENGSNLQRSNSTLRASSTNSSSANQQASSRSSSRLSIRKEDVSMDSSDDRSVEVEKLDQLSASWIENASLLTERQLSFSNLEAKSLILKVKTSEIQSQSRDLKILSMINNTLKISYETQGLKDVLDHHSSWGTSSHSLELLIRNKIKSLLLKAESLESKLKSDSDLQPDKLKVLLSYEMNLSLEDLEKIEAEKKESVGKKKNQNGKENQESKLGLNGKGRKVLKRLKEGVQDVEKLVQELKGWQEVLELET